MPRNTPQYRVFIGFDAKEMETCNIAVHSLYRYAPRAAIEAHRIDRLLLWRVYHRPTTLMPNGQYYDEISEAPMSTGHAIARFFVPYCCGYEGWALFTDGDVLFRRDVRELFALADDRYAVMAVQHPPQTDERTKKDGHIQQAYARKNWSSVMLFNCGHPANRLLTLDVLNAWPGRDLHAFTWLPDESLLGALPAEWNYLVGVNVPMPDPALVHYTLGTPGMEGHAEDPFAAEWFATARAAGYDVPESVLAADEDRAHGRG